MPLTLIVIYRKSTGEILSSSSGGSFRYRKQLHDLYPEIPPKDLAFYYEETDTQVIPGHDRIVIQGPGIPPLLVDSTGEPKAFAQFIINQRQAIASKQILRVECEYGMGDQILALEAIATFQKKNPNHPVKYAVHPDYFEILQYASPRPNVILSATAHEPQKEYVVTLNPIHRLWDPRAPKFGKADFYAAHIGLDKSTETVTLTPIKQPAQAPGIQAAQLAVEKKQPILAIHTKSASRTASTWNPRKALALSDKWFQATGGHTFLIGTLPDWTVHPAHTFTLPQRSTWIDVAYFLQKSALAVCIDSGPMHLARASNVPLITLWGGSGPTDILGREVNDHDIRAPFDCINQLCPSCRKPPPSCMDWITPEFVFERIAILYPHFMVG